MKIPYNVLKKFPKIKGWVWQYPKTPLIRLLGYPMAHARAMVLASSLLWRCDGCLDDRDLVWDDAIKVIDEARRSRDRSPRLREIGLLGLHRVLDKPRNVGDIR